MRLEVNICQLKEVLMFFEDSPKLKTALKIILLMGSFSVVLVILAIAWRIAGF